MKIKKINSLKWLLEPLSQDPDYIERQMFGCLAAYAHGKLMAVLADKKDPWRGLLVPTEREYHESLMLEFPALISHPILGKWLYISVGHPEFEETATKIIDKCYDNDPRMGVVPKPKTKPKSNPKFWPKKKKSTRRAKQKPS